jgi:poly-gamma-glutamate synthesis protein (capsule biosynthesis protein)
MRFTFSPRIRDILLENNFGLVSIGNNHIRDYGTDGVRQTTAYLSGTNIDYVGDPTGSGVEPVYKEVNGVRIAFVSYSDFAFGDAERARAALRSASSTADFVVLMTHWGNEYESTPPMRVRQLAYGFVAAGADLIIGTHSHVIGEVEELAGRRIYYSLGNFIFDQYWMPEVRCGLTVLATVTKKDGVTTAAYAETPVGMDTDGSTGPVCS